MQINAQFRDETLAPTDFSAVLARFSRIVDAMAQRQPDLAKANWCLKGDSPKKSKLYPAFAGEQASSSALAVLSEEFRRKPNRSFVAIWDGNETSPDGVNMVCHTSLPGKLNSFAIEILGEHGLINEETITQVLTHVAREFKPAYAEVSPAEYFERRVFDDKPGVGWMLYLPKVVTTQQVPEARALVPVPEAGRAQTGTIIVSVIGEVFSADNPEHVAAANRIEIRLVDLDLLPSYSEI